MNPRCLTWHSLGQAPRRLLWSSPLCDACWLWAQGISPGYCWADCLRGGPGWQLSFHCLTCQHIPISCSVFQRFVEISCPFKVLFQQTFLILSEFFSFVFWRFHFARDSGEPIRLSTILQLKPHQIVLLKGSIWLLAFISLFLKWELYHKHTYIKEYISVHTYNLKRKSKKNTGTYHVAWEIECHIFSSLKPCMSFLDCVFLIPSASWGNRYFSFISHSLAFYKNMNPPHGHLSLNYTLFNFSYFCSLYK